VRTRRKRRADDLFGGESGNLLQGRYQTEAVYAWFQKRHRSGLKFIDEDGYYVRNEHEWKVPYGVRYMLHERLLPAQVSNKYPFQVSWRSPRTGRRLFKNMQSLPHAIRFVAERAQYVDPKACIINRLGMDIPPKYRNKIPPPYKWCPRCMKPRRMRRLYRSTGDPQIFYGTVKVWNEQKGYYEYPEKKLALMACEVCGGTNRDPRFRRSNQPWETVVVKQGRSRVRRHRGRRNAKGRR